MNQIIIFDTETTGIPDWKTPSGGPDQPHIVQLAAHQVDVENRQILQTMDVIVKPDGWEISQEITDICGITQEHAHDVGVSEKLALEMFLALWDGRTRIAYNTTFDNRIIRIGTKRYFPDEIINRWHDGKQGQEWRCMMLAAKKVMGGKQPKLIEAYKHFFGQDFKGEHTAIGDVNATLELFWEIG